MGVVSNSRSEESVRGMLRATGIEEFFRVVVSSGTEGVAKPDPEIFRRAVARWPYPSRSAFTSETSRTPTRRRRDRPAFVRCGCTATAGGSGRPP